MRSCQHRAGILEPRAGVAHQGDACGWRRDETQRQIWTEAAAPRLEDMRHRRFGGVCVESMRQSGATVNPGASGIFQPCVLFDAYSQFEEKKNTKPQWMPISFWSCRGSLLLGRHRELFCFLFFFFWKGNVSLAPRADVTNALLRTCALTKLPLTGGRPHPLRFAGISGKERGLSSPILTSSDRPLERLFLRTQALLSFPGLAQFSSEIRFFFFFLPS